MNKLEVDNSYLPAPENVPIIDVDVDVDDAFAEWEHDGVCQC